MLPIKLHYFKGNLIKGIFFNKILCLFNQKRIRFYAYDIPLFFITYSLCLSFLKESIVFLFCTTAS